MLFCLKTETEPVFGTLCFFKKLEGGQVLKKKMVFLTLDYEQVGSPETSIRDYHPMFVIPQKSGNFT
jgi:hypothetical protein